MAKYILQNLEGETLAEGSKKQTLINKATEQSLLAFRVVTDKGNVVHEEDHREMPEDFDTVQEPVEADLPAEEDLIGDVTPDAPSEPETVFYETLEFPGNYSIVTAPMALEIAAAAGVPAKSENIKGSLTRKVFFGGDDMDLTARTVSFIQERLPEVLADLKVWQKKHAERRRTLTDMERYVEHREFIAKAGTRIAKQVKKDGI